MYSTTLLAFAIQASTLKMILLKQFAYVQLVTMIYRVNVWDAHWAVRLAHQPQFANPANPVYRPKEDSASAYRLRHSSTLMENAWNARILSISAPIVQARLLVFNVMLAQSANLKMEYAYAGLDITKILTRHANYAPLRDVLSARTAKNATSAMRRSSGKRIQILFSASAWKDMWKLPKDV